MILVWYLQIYFKRFTYSQLIKSSYNSLDSLTIFTHKICIQFLFQMFCSQDSVIRFSTILLSNFSDKIIFKSYPLYIPFFSSYFTFSVLAGFRASSQREELERRYGTLGRQPREQREPREQPPPYHILPRSSYLLIPQDTPDLLRYTEVTQEF